MCLSHKQFSLACPKPRLRVWEVKVKVSDPLLVYSNFTTRIVSLGKCANFISEKKTTEPTEAPMHAQAMPAMFVLEQ